MSEPIYLVAEVDGQPVDHDSFDGDLTVRISSPAAENGHPVSGPLSWLNSARITADSHDDAVYLSVSVGDPRGGFFFAVRRLRDGRMVIHHPHPGESLAHMDTVESHPGTIQVVGNFADDEEEE
jgi:hypothetical protein